MSTAKTRKLDCITVTPIAVDLPRLCLVCLKPIRPGDKWQASSSGDIIVRVHLTCLHPQNGKQS